MMRGRALLQQALCSLIILVMSTMSYAFDIQVQAVDASTTELVVSDANLAKPNTFNLDNPARMVIDFESAKAAKQTIQVNSSCVTQIRSAQHKVSIQRVVVDLKAECTATSYLKKSKLENKFIVRLSHASDVLPKKLTKPKVAPARKRPFIVAIDAGHGGKDPGAISAKGTKEKDIVLGISKKLYKLINKQPNLRAVLIRDGDYYLGLKDRNHRARQLGADLFLSIHADAFKDSKAHGASVFVLSQTGASSEAARWLAESENQADLIGGIRLDDKDNLLASILLDLSQTASQQTSRSIAQLLTHTLARVTPMHKKKVESANFVVLRSPDLPSILIETGFISNAKGEKRLKSNAYQWQLAEAILRGVKEYYHGIQLPIALPEHRWLKDVTHIVKNGESLSIIAERYQTDVDTLKAVNHLKSSKIHPRQRLTVPGQPV